MNIFLGVTGSISAYKSYDLLRKLVEKKHQVIVVLTDKASKFVNPQVFMYLGAKAVYSSLDDFSFPKNPATSELQTDTDSSKTVLHIELARFADLFILAPASAQSISRLAQGSADDLLSSIFLASPKDKNWLIFPSMNPHMWSHPITQRNIHLLQDLTNTKVISPASGVTLCGDEGVGRLPPLDLILDIIHVYQIKIIQKRNIIDNPLLQKKTILISTGATLTPLDPIRYLTNGSTGWVGYTLALEFLLAGYKVHVVATKTSTARLKDLLSFKLFSIDWVTTPQSMLNLVTEHFQSPETHAFFSAAAVGDIAFAVQTEKIKKETLPEALPVMPTQDILKKCLELRKKHQSVVGFSAESSFQAEALNNKWQRKPVDLAVINCVNHGHIETKDQAIGFGPDKNHYYFWRQDSGVDFHPLYLDKHQLADHLGVWLNQNQNIRNNQ